MPCTRRTYKRTVVILALTAVFLVLPPPANAAWTREAGRWFSAHTLTTYRTNHFIDDNGTSLRQPAFAKQEWNGYFEYGWRDSVTVGANLFLHRLAADYRRYEATSPTIVHGTDENHGLADSEFFLRKRLWQGVAFGNQAVVSVQPLIKLPSLYEAGGDPRSGTEDFDAELRLQGGMNFDFLGRSHFSTVELAYRKRMGEWGDQYRVDATLGFTLTPQFTLLMQQFLTQRVDGSTRTVSGSGEVSDYDLTKAQISLVYRVNATTRLQLGGFRHIHARNTGDGEGMLLSLWKEF
jgi:protein XagA